MGSLSISNRSKPIEVVVVVVVVGHSVFSGGIPASNTPK